MSKCYAIGGLLCLGGLIFLLFQGVSSLVISCGTVWKSISMANFLRQDHILWIDEITWSGIKYSLWTLVTFPLDVLLFCASGCCFLMGGFTK